MKIEDLILENIIEEKYPSLKISLKNEFQCIWRDFDSDKLVISISLKYYINSMYIYFTDFENQSLRYPILMKLRKNQTWVKVEDFIEAHSED